MLLLFFILTMMFGDPLGEFSFFPLLLILCLEAVHLWLKCTSCNLSFISYSFWYWKSIMGRSRRKWNNKICRRLEENEFYYSFGEWSELTVATVSTEWFLSSHSVLNTFLLISFLVSSPHSLCLIFLASLTIRLSLVSWCSLYSLFLSLSLVQKEWWWKENETRSASAVFVFLIITRGHIIYFPLFSFSCLASTFSYIFHHLFFTHCDR